MKRVISRISSVLLLLAALVGAFLTTRTGPDYDSASEECRVAYRRARTAAESTMVDRMRNGESLIGLNCGTRRTTGRIRP